MISVVMATYNGEKYLREQLVSILKQSRKPDEIVINDDCSTDHTVDIIEDVKFRSDIPIYVQINKERLGYAQNFRRVIRRAKGDIIFLSDQDDVWLIDKIEICMSVFDKNKEVLSLSTGYYVTNDLLNRRKPSDIIRPGSLVKITWKQFIRHPKYPGMSMAFRKMIWLDIDSMNWKEKASHDWMINQYAAAYNGMYIIGNKTALYRQHDNNAEGIIINMQKEHIRNVRVKLIDELIDELESIDWKGHKNDAFLKKALFFQKKRRSFIETSNIIDLLIFELRRIDCISIRSVLGDLYVCIKSRKG